LRFLAIGSNGDNDVIQIFSTGSAFAALRSDGSVVTWGNCLQWWRQQHDDEPTHQCGELANPCTDDIYLEPPGISCSLWSGYFTEGNRKTDDLIKDTEITRSNRTFSRR